MTGRPQANLEVDLAKSWTWRTRYAHIGYNEKGPLDPTGPHDFRRNLLTLSRRYSF